MRDRLFLTVVAVCLLTTNATAQGLKKEPIVSGEGVGGGTITDGVNQWVVTGASSTDGISTNYEVPIGTDHQFSTWWWYRVAGDTAETIMPPPDTEDYMGETATFTWSDVDGRGLFDVQLTVLILEQGAGSWLIQNFSVANISGSNLDLDAFAYTDMDMDTSAGGDSAVELTAHTMLISETSAAVFATSPMPDGYRVDAFSAVRDALNDSVVDNFANTGLPFGPADFTGGFQWNRVIESGGVFGMSTAMCVNEGCVGLPIFGDGFETGDTSNWDNTVP